MGMTLSMESINGILERFRQLYEKLQYPAYGSDLTVLMILMGGLTVFGILNVFLGFRLMRFWMMLGSLGIGFLTGFVLRSWMGLTTAAFLGISLGLGILLAVLSFFIYNWGVFLVGLGSGTIIGIYILKPTSSLVFFLCILFGAVLGVLGMKFSRVILIFGTSVLGGALCGVTIAWFIDRLGQPSPIGIPYEVLLGVGLTVPGAVVQFLMNPAAEEEEDEEEQDPEENFADRLYRKEIEEGRPVGSEKIRRDELGRKYLD